MKFTYTSGSSPLQGYTIKRGVGAGGFGEVYYATSEGGKEVALKHIQRHLDIEIRGVKHCLNLKHPNLVALYDIKYDEAGEGWVVMEYVSGQSLQDEIEAHPDGMPLHNALSWFNALAAGVGYLHDHGIVHRDLKPGNIFNDNGIVKIGDYGLSKFISVSRRSGQTESVGTFHYMAPEISKGNYGREIDIYALGIILCEMLTGRVPFEGESSQEIIMKHLTADPDLTGLEEPFYSAIADCLVKDPDHRIHTAEELLQRIGLSPADPMALQQGFVQHLSTDNGVPNLDENDIHVGKNSRVSEKAEAVVAAQPNNKKQDREEYVIPMAIPEQAAVEEDEEPIAKAFNKFFSDFSSWWNNDNISTIPKVLVMGLLVFFFIGNAAWLLPTSFVLGAIYFAYLLVRTVTLQSGSKSTAQPARPPQAKQQYHPEAMARKQKAKENRKKKPSRKEMDRVVLSKKSMVDSATELTGSLLMSAVVAVILSIVLLPAGSVSYESPVSVWAPMLAWMIAIITCGSWLILIPSKFWEASEGEAIFRRFWMLGLGILLGAFVLGTSGLLFVNLPNVETNEISRLLFTQRVTADYAVQNGQYTTGSYLIYFAGLFLTLRWWKMADPLRKTRLSVWSTIVCVLWAVILNACWPFAQPWGVMTAGAIAVAVQLSAPWVSPRKRDERRAVEFPALTKTSAPYEQS